MNRFSYKKSGKDIILTCSDFDLDETLDCGQAFRWEKTTSNTYKGFALNTPLTISQDGNTFTLKDTDEEKFLTVWANYFDLYTDYGEIKRRLSGDKTLASAVSFAGGIRLLRQDKWEALCSFIISQNNNIPRIKGIIGRLCEHYGEFPSYLTLSAETTDTLGFLRAGFRAKYILDAAYKLSTNELSLEEISKMPLDNARSALMTIKGVGPKVAECALLYGMHKTEAFPIDVWISRVMKRYYPNGLPDCTKGIEGIAQQYLFHYIRNSEK
ncbi:MAG: DNA-3-methyladenine glycosylase 2 family protein [Ruminococcus sp.]|nr:DNA-3-methyladenine glycosylase 2 family protein [Ruminococcus sp.]